MADEKYNLACPICNKIRTYKSKDYLNKLKKSNAPCRSCSNSIQMGGKGYLIKDNQKICSHCHIYKNFDEFLLLNNNKLSSRCKDCNKIYNSKYHKEKFRFNKYGITKQIFDDLIKIQNYKCAICEISINERSSNIDHCHSTNKVRGILCEKCNKGLGQFNDNINYLTNAIKYLKND